MKAKIDRETKLHIRTANLAGYHEHWNKENSSDEIEI